MGYLEDLKDARGVPHTVRLEDVDECACGSWKFKNVKMCQRCQEHER